MIGTACDLARVAILAQWIKQRAKELGPIQAHNLKPIVRPVPFDDRCAKSKTIIPRIVDTQRCTARMFRSSAGQRTRYTRPGRRTGYIA